MAKSFYEDFQSRKSAQDSSGDMFETSAERIQQMQQMKSYLQQVQSMGASANDLKLSIKNRMKGAEAYVNAVAQGLLADPIYSTFLQFEVNSLVINTTSTDVNTNIMLSFDNEKNGTGKANTFHIRIVYAPNLDDSNFQIDLIDNALETAVNAEGELFSNRYCTLTYGYASLNGQQLISTKYVGMVLDYSCEIQDSMLYYDITGYSSIVLWNESKEPLIIEPESGQTIQPTKAVRQIVEKYLREGNNLSNKAYEVVFDEGVEGSDCAITLSTELDKNPSKAIDDVLKAACHQSQQHLLSEGNVQCKDEELITYNWHISDHAPDRNSEAAGVIHVTMNDPKENLKSIADANLVFNWMSPKAGDALSHIVINFKPEFQGKVRLALAAQLLGSSNSASPEDCCFLDDQGELKPMMSSRSPQTGGNHKTVATNIKQEKSSWVEDMQYPYKATLVTMGIPVDIPITGKIQVVPMIYGQKHHSAGVYEVLGTVDRIDSGGQFTTEWSLLKVAKSANISN